ncbi:MAG: hypothetical protein CMM66_01130, partial [Rhodospirillaceae bacterium]|nr:hypothetical protein [Rhodospirillaceae bacterium]
MVRVDCFTSINPHLFPFVSTSLISDPTHLELDLPDPDKDDISTIEFLAQLEKAWA